MGTSVGLVGFGKLGTTGVTSGATGIGVVGVTLADGMLGVSSGTTSTGILSDDFPVKHFLASIPPALH